jgi:monoamine oxidase
MASQSDAELLLEARLVAVDQDDHGVTCTTVDGATIRAAALVLALPINCLPAIAFTPALPAATAEAAGANAGAAVKVLMLTRGVEPLTIAVGIGPGLNWLYADDAVGDEVLVTGFGWEDESFDQQDRDDVVRALTAFHPGAELLDWASHDWIADPHSMGTWLTAPAGHVDLVDPARFTPAGRIVFAGSDVAEEQAGWFEGALRSGAAAARTVVELLG